MGTKQVKVNLAVQSQIEALKKMSFGILSAIESNTGQKITDISFVFIQDSELKLLGSKDCWVRNSESDERPEVLVPKIIKQPIRPNKTCAGDFCLFVVKIPVNAEDDFGRELLITDMTLEYREDFADGVLNDMPCLLYTSDAADE